VLTEISTANHPSTLQLDYFSHFFFSKRVGPDIPLLMFSISNNESKHQADFPLKRRQIRVLETPVKKRPVMQLNILLKNIPQF
jgi:hypothetical protein